MRDTQYPSLLNDPSLVLSTPSTAVAASISAASILSSIPNACGRVMVADALSCRIVFTGTGADDSQFSCYVWCRIGVGGVNANGTDAPNTCHEVFYLGKADNTLSAAVGVSGGAVGTTDRIADTIVWTPSSASTTPPGPLDQLAVARGVSSGVSYSPANNTPACLSLPYLCDAAELIFDFVLSTATSANAYVLTNRSS